MTAKGPGVPRFLSEGRAASEGDARRVRGRDRVLALPCLIRVAPVGTPTAARLLAEADALACAPHPWLAPVVARFQDEGDARSLSGAGPVAGYALFDPPEPTMGEALVDTPPATRLVALAALLHLLAHLHARGLAHGHLGPESVRWRDGAPWLTWGDLGAKWPVKAPPDSGPAAADVLAVGALARDLLRGWSGPARVVFDRLAARPGGGPTPGAAALVDDLAAHGVVATAPAQRDEELPIEAVAAALPDLARPIAFVGGDLGRGLLVARAVLARARRSGLHVLDVSRATSPLGAIHRWLLAGDRPSTYDPEWVESVRYALIEPRPATAVLLGDVGRWSAAERAVLEPLAQVLSRAGVRVLLASPVAVPGALTLSLPTARHVVEPSASLAPILRGLRGLPVGVPSRVVAALPVAHRTALPELVRAGLARFEEDGSLVVSGAGTEPLDPELARAVEATLLDPFGDTDPLWRALAWVATGRLDRAGALLAESRRVAGGREDLLLTLATRLAGSGHTAARHVVAELDLLRGRPHRVVAALGGLPDDDPHTTLLVARALRQIGRASAAIARLRPIAEAHDQGATWCELARAFAASGRHGEATEALERAVRSPRPPSRRALLAARVHLARTSSPGPAPEAVLALLEALQGLDSPPPALLAGVASVLERAGEPGRAGDLVGTAIERAEASGATHLAAALRVQAARHARRSGRSAAARAMLHEVRLAARIGGWPLLERTALARLVDLEASEGRKGAARATLDALEPLLAAAGPSERVEVTLLSARVALATGAPAEALRGLSTLDPLAMPDADALRHALLRAQALLESGRAAEARQIAEATPVPTDPATARRLMALRGRIHLALGRRYLAEARQRLPSEPLPGERVEVGEILLAWAGEDLDPEQIPGRAREIGRAAGLLEGTAARERAEKLATAWLPTAPAAVTPRTEAEPVVAAAPREVLGVLLGRPEEALAIETTVALLDPSRSNNLMITGPTGAGKRVFAERLAKERLGLDGLEEVVLRRTDPQMLVSQLVGTRRGEFTGAVDQTGVIQRAIQGRKALLLDELHTLDRVGQEILLPLLELPRRRFGGLLRSSQEIEGPLQILLATNVDVSGSRWRDRFRSDLWFRMSQLHVHLPPLADRGQAAIWTYFVRMLAEEGVDDPERVVEPKAIWTFLAQPWEGNLRELHAAVRRLVAFHRQQGRPVGADDLPRLTGAAEIPSIAPYGSRDVLETLELNAVLEALRRCDWSQQTAADHLAISKYRLHRILQKHDLLEWVRDRRKTAAGSEDLD